MGGMSASATDEGSVGAAAEVVGFRSRLSVQIFQFITDDCRLDGPDDEPEQLRRALARPEAKSSRGTASGWRSARSRICPQRFCLMRFDADSLARGITARMAVLLLAELVGTEADRERRGEMACVREVIGPFQALLKGVFMRCFR